MWPDLHDRCDVGQIDNDIDTALILALPGARNIGCGYRFELQEINKVHPHPPNKKGNSHFLLQTQMFHIWNLKHNLFNKSDKKNFLKVLLSTADCIHNDLGAIK